MNKTISIAAKSVLLGTVLAMGAACSATSTRESTGEYVDSATLTTKVKAALAREAGVSSLVNVQVETFRDTVQLSGFVGSEEDRELAETIASNVNGVTNVENSIGLKPES